MIFISAGMNMALGLGWSQYAFFGGILHFCYSWFIGVIIGALLAIPLRMVISKKFIFVAAGLLVLAGGIIFTCLPLDYNAILSARYLNGIAQGLTTVAFLLLSSEVSIDSKRGLCVTMEQYSISAGLAIQMIYASTWSAYDFPMLRLHGILDIIFGVGSLIMFFLYIESPIDLIRQGQEVEALNTLARLQRPGVITIETQAWFEQCKSYVREHESMSYATSMRLAAWPLVKMLFFRCAILAFCFSLPLNMFVQYSMVINYATWVPIVAGCCRILAGIITVFLSDSMRRKIPSLFWMICIGGLLIGMGSIFQNLLAAISDSDNMYTISILYILIQLCAGFYSPFTSVLLAEAFPLKVKGYMMDICVIVEQLIQIILINTINVHMADATIAQGVIVVLTVAAMVVALPETKGTSLAEAQRRFRNPLYTKFD